MQVVNFHAITFVFHSLFRLNRLFRSLAATILYYCYRHAVLAETLSYTYVIASHRQYYIWVKQQNNESYTIYKWVFTRKVQHDTFEIIIRRSPPRVNKKRTQTFSFVKRKIDISRNVNESVFKIIAVCILLSEDDYERG